MFNNFQTYLDLSVVEDLNNHEDVGQNDPMFKDSVKG